MQIIIKHIKHMKTKKTTLFVAGVFFLLLCTRTGAQHGVLLPEQHTHVHADGTVCNHDHHVEGKEQPFVLSSTPPPYKRTILKSVNREFNDEVDLRRLHHPNLRDFIH